MPVVQIPASPFSDAHLFALSPSRKKGGTAGTVPPNRHKTDMDIV